MSVEVLGSDGSECSGLGLVLNRNAQFWFALELTCRGQNARCKDENPWMYEGRAFSENLRLQRYWGDGYCSQVPFRTFTVVYLPAPTPQPRMCRIGYEDFFVESMDDSGGMPALILWRTHDCRRDFYNAYRWTDFTQKEHRKCCFVIALLSSHGRTK